MNSLFTFLIQSSTALVLFYLVFWVFLRKETFYTSNRFFLLFALLSSILIPLIPIQYVVYSQVGNANNNILTEVESAFNGVKPYVGSGFETSYSISWINALLIIYLTGTAIFLFRLLVQTLSLVIRIVKNKIIIKDGLRIIETEKYGLPFSFFNVVYINPKLHKQDVLPEILAHEKVHISEKHWVDLLIIELLTVIFWFNPIIWFFEHSIKLNHEYLADHGVIINGNHIGKYQALLVNQLMGMQIIGITNNLNFGINTNRLKMMTKQKTHKIRAIKLIWALPVLALLLYAFAEPNYNVIEKQQTENDNLKSQIIEGKTKIISGTVVDEIGEPIPGVTVMAVGTTKGTTTDFDGTFSFKISANDKIQLSYIGFEPLNFTLEDIFFLDNKKIVLKKALIYLDPKSFSEKELPIQPPRPTKKNLNKNGEEEIFYIVEQMPEYPGGDKALGDYINDLTQKLVKSENIKGKAKVGFTVDENGNATNIKIIEQENELAGKGAATIIMKMKKWSPGKQRGKKVPVNFVLPIEF